MHRAFERARINVFGHVGDGNIHFNVLDAPNESKGMVNQIVHNTVIARGGSISAEHGIGCYRLAELEQYKHPAELQLMRSIKKSLDPSEIFNPGKVLRLPLRAIAT